jgi:hypothetical protein
MKMPAAIVSLAAALVFAGAAAGSTTFGITDDAGKYADDGGAAFFSTLTDLGMHENRVTVLWDPANPTTIADQAFLDRSVPQAVARGVDLVFGIYPAKARGLADTPNGVQLFAQFAATVAQRYPQVTKVICLNEGNQTRFQQPQFDASGKGVAGALQEAAMAACYDALKAVNPAIDVIGFGFSPRGNDDPTASSNVSHSPIRLLKEIGDAYRASGRALPIADDVAIHCYPNQNTDAPTVGYAWPNVGCANLDRFKQAWWDAFHGTGQPVFQELGGTSTNGLGTFVRFVIDEVGYQVKIASEQAGNYTGSENVPTLDDATQASYYTRLIAMTACDTSVALFNIFHLVDETSLPAWQSGLVAAGGTHRTSYDAVKAAVAANQQCQGTLHTWRHATSVVGANVDFAGLRRSFVVTASEGYTWKVTVRRGKKTVSSTTGDGRANADLLFRLRHLKRGSYRVIVELSAETNSDRVSTFTARFRVT